MQATPERTRAVVDPKKSTPRPLSSINGNLCQTARKARFMVVGIPVKSLIGSVLANKLCAPYTRTFAFGASKICIMDARETQNPLYKDDLCFEFT